MNRLTGDFKGVSMFATVEQALQYNRLRRYEDTGLMPDEIAALQAELDAFKADVEAGRLVRYPEFPQDMNDLLEPLKVQSALNSEVMKLNFRKEHRPKDVSILDYTVIAALNKVLDEAARAALEGGQQ
jgi:uncharacterized protein involved in exopolysaccharide biosynthesis